MLFQESWAVEIYEAIDGTRTLDISFYIQEAQAAKGLVVDAACGSGRLLLPMRSAGVDVYGFDNSDAMLRKLDLSLGEADRHRVRIIDLNQPDYTWLPEPPRLVICAFNSFLHLMSQEAQLAFLRKTYDALAPGGSLILDVINPFILDLDRSGRKSFEATVVDPATDEEISIWRWFEYDVVNQTAEYHREYRAKSGETRNSTVDFRWVYPQEMKLLLSAAGFSQIQCFGGFNREALDGESEVQVWRGKRLA